MNIAFKRYPPDGTNWGKYGAEQEAGISMTARQGGGRTGKYLVVPASYGAITRIPNPLTHTRGCRLQRPFKRCGMGVLDSKSNLHGLLLPLRLGS